MDSSTETAITAVASLVGAITGLLLVGGGVVSWIAKRRAAVMTELTRWSLRLGRGRETAPYDAELTRDGEGASVHLVRLAVICPGGATVVYYSRSGDIRGPAASVDVNEDLRASPGESPSAVLELRVPCRPKWSFSHATRLRIAVTFEERSASRRQRKIIVTSQQIPWTASATAVTA